MALPAAHVLSHYQFRGRALVRALVPVPFVLPTVVVGAAFLALLGPRSPLGVDLDETVWAILLAHVFFNHAVVVRIVGGLWEGLDPSTEEAARTLGATRWRAFTTVTLPALWPAIVAAASIVFLFTFTSFGVVQILGGPGQATLEVEIYRQTADLLDLPVAAVLSLIQLTAVGVLLVVQDRLDRRRVGLRLRPVAPRRPHGTGETGLGQRQPGCAGGAARSAPRRSGRALLSRWATATAWPLGRRWGSARVRRASSYRRLTRSPPHCSSRRSPR